MKMKIAPNTQVQEVLSTKDLLIFQVMKRVLAFTTKNNLSPVFNSGEIE